MGAVVVGGIKLASRLVSIGAGGADDSGADVCAMAGPARTAIKPRNAVVLARDTVIGDCLFHFLRWRHHRTMRQPDQAPCNHDQQNSQKQYDDAFCFHFSPTFLASLVASC